MELIKLKVLDKVGTTLLTCPAAEQVSLVYRAEYCQGDRITLEIGTPGQYVVVQFEDTMAPVLLYVEKREIIFTIPFGEQTQQIEYDVPRPVGLAANSANKNRLNDALCKQAHHIKDFTKDIHRILLFPSYVAKGLRLIGVHASGKREFRCRLTARLVRRDNRAPCPN